MSVFGQEPEVEDHPDLYCICPNCPTYTECSRQIGEVAFCKHGRTQNCTVIEKTCNCPNCIVHQLTERKKIFYCKRGLEGEQVT